MAGALIPVVAWAVAPGPPPAPILVQGQAASERAIPLLRVGFGVVARDGTPVTDLRADEISIRIANQMRAVRSLQAVTISSSPGDAAAGAVPLPFGTNAREAVGRTIMLAIDEDSFRPGRENPLREAVDLMVQRLTPSDRLGLVTMPYGSVKVPLTGEHARVRAAVSQIVGRAPSDETGSSFACRTRDTLTALRSYLGSLGVGDDSTTLVFFTGGLAAPRRDAPPTLAPGLCELRTELFEEVGVAAGAARAHFYIVQPGDPLERMPGVTRENIAGAGFEGSDNPMEGIEHLAGVTGGKILYLTGSEDTALGRVVRETATGWVAAIEPDRNDRSGRPQRLDVRVSRPGVEVRAARHITFARPEPTLARLADPSPRDMLSVPIVFRDLPLRAAAFTPVDEDPAMMRVVTLAEPMEADVTLTSLVAALFDPGGTAVAQWVATDAELRQRPVVGAMRVPAGGYRLRVAAIDATGRAGTADYDVAPDVSSSGPLKISSLVLGLSREGAFVPRLQFTTEPVALGYVEMAGAAAGTKVTATLELARTLNGPALLAVPLAIQGTSDNRYTARGAIPIGALEPGDYVVRALVGMDGHPTTRVVRTLRKVR